jgi:group II intron reverse transcriptase/maturase
MMAWWRRRVRSEQAAADSAAAPTPAPVRSQAALPPVQAGPLRCRPGEEWFTPESLRRAWLAIKRAGGGAGVDGVTLELFASRLDKELETLRLELAGGRYRPRPLRQVLIPKSNGGLRPLVLWALRDRIAQRALHDILAPCFEPLFLPCSFGFRPGLGVEDAVRQVERHRDDHLRWVVHGDVRSCFDELDSRRLLRLIQRRVHDPLLVGYVRMWLHARLLNSADGLPKEAGASQGSVLSPLLANIYLHDFDQRLTRQQLALVRYADDFVICCRRRADAAQALTAAQESLTAIGLAMSERKTAVNHFDAGFEWLGYFFVRGECYRL